MLVMLWTVPPPARGDRLRECLQQGFLICRHYVFSFSFPVPGGVRPIPTNGSLNIGHTRKNMKIKFNHQRLQVGKTNPSSATNVLTQNSGGPNSVIADATKNIGQSRRLRYPVKRAMQPILSGFGGILVQCGIARKERPADATPNELSATESVDYELALSRPKRMLGWIC